MSITKNKLNCHTETLIQVPFIIFFLFQMKNEGIILLVMQITKLQSSEKIAARITHFYTKRKKTFQLIYPTIYYYYFIQYYKIVNKPPVFRVMV